MKKTLLSCCLIFAFLATSCGDTTPIDKAYNRGMNVTPMPMEMAQQEGIFVLDKNVVFVSCNEDVDKIATFFSAKIKTSTGFDLQIKCDKPANNYINLQIDESLDVNDEGYSLISTSAGIDIKAKTPHGLFYGMQTVMQLLPAEIESSAKVSHVAWNIPAVVIKDQPRFQYRGQHLDVCRHFASVEFVKKQIDLLSMLKINTLHWHLTEDQGWRVEIKKYPKLTEVGAVRVEGDGSTYGPFFYTQEQIKEVVAYATERFVDVIPELELPGHAVAAGAAYPHLVCTDEPLEVRNYWGVSKDVFCVGNDDVFTFIEDVIDELVPLFPSKYFHIGGDECLKVRWEECPKCQARAKKEGLKADAKGSVEEKLQSYFIKRVSKIVDKHNKVMIGWDEILEGGLAESAVVMSWRGEKGGIEAGNMGHDVIMTPGDWMYLDKYQGDSKILPVTIGGLLTLKKVYGYEPIPEGLAEDKRHHVLGLQATNWNEYKYTEADMQHDLFPRLIAVAEIGWTANEKKDYENFLTRLDNQRVRLDMHNVNYYIPLPQTAKVPSCNFVAFVDSAHLAFETTEPVKMVYTLDGSEPTLTSAEYTEAFTFTENTTLKMRSILVSEKMSPVRTITIEKQTYAPAVEVINDAKKGILAEYYKGEATKKSDLEGKKPVDSEYIKSPKEGKYMLKNYGEFTKDDYYSTVLTGYVNIPEDGIYYFGTDGELFIDDKLLISNEHENTARRFSRSDSSIALAKGAHKVKLIRFGATIGGWPTQWDYVYIKIKKEGEPYYRIMDAPDFEVK